MKKVIVIGLTLCATLFFVAPSINAADERPLLQRVCREVARSVDIGGIEKCTCVGLIVATALIMYDAVNNDTNVDGHNICRNHYGATVVVTNDGGSVICPYQHHPEVLSLDKAFCPIL